MQIIFTARCRVTQPLPQADIESDYEANTGRAIIRAMEGRAPLGCPAALVAGHAPFCWGNPPVTQPTPQ